MSRRRRYVVLFIVLFFLREDSDYSENRITLRIQKFLENIYQVDGCFGGANVVGVPFIDFRAAIDALVLLEINVVVAESDGGFEVPMAVENPAVAVGESCAGKPSFVAVVLHVVPQGEDGRLESHGVVDAAHEMEAEEMPVEDIAEPIAQFGLQHGNLVLLGVGEFPGIVVAGQVGGELAGKGHFDGGIGQTENVKRNIRLDGNLCRGGTNYTYY